MQFSYLAPLALAAVAAADYTNSTDVTTIVKFTTYCPEATTFAVNNKTYTVTGKTTLTITDCPCTIHPATSTPSKSTLATSSATSSEANTLSTATGAAAKAGVAGLAALLVPLLTCCKWLEFLHISMTFYIWVGD
ncbi:DEBR0S1_28304g1_1 [Brettanomyces bruxellensis]|uniref:DEBR0S1_28304g1_1 n=1 Tax=Dekkera bruxellensis TaxID=5007 RepID=A0A7D9CVS2_DEKBR|nr:DEBR0S1_28304g1_1 [Brettanomyces bruxellensis]